MTAIVLFDGDCSFCNKSVQFIIKRDPNFHFQFASLQGDYGKRLLKAYKVTSNIDSIVLIENEQFYLRSTAALMICRKLKGLWPLLSIGLTVPGAFRDFIYDQIAKNRYKFSKNVSCMIPTPNDRKRFLD